MRSTIIHLPCSTEGAIAVEIHFVSLPITCMRKDPLFVLGQIPNRASRFDAFLSPGQTIDIVDIVKHVVSTHGGHSVYIILGQRDVRVTIVAQVNGVEVPIAAGQDLGPATVNYA